jgi:hypothetical protein
MKNICRVSIKNPMSCTKTQMPQMMAASGPPLAMQVAFGSDAFGTGCQAQCGFPMDCGANFPAYKYYTETMSSCLFSPPFANSRLSTPLCQTCERVIPTDNLMIPQTVLFTPYKDPPSPRPTFVYKTPTSC